MLLPITYVEIKYNKQYYLCSEVEVRSYLFILDPVLGTTEKSRQSLPGPEMVLYLPRSKCSRMTIHCRNKNKVKMINLGMFHLLIVPHDHQGKVILQWLSIIKFINHLLKDHWITLKGLYLLRDQHQVDLLLPREPQQVDLLPLYILITHPLSLLPQFNPHPLLSLRPKPQTAPKPSKIQIQWPPASSSGPPENTKPPPPPKKPIVPPRKWWHTLHCWFY